QERARPRPPRIHVRPRTWPHPPPPPHKPHETHRWALRDLNPHGFPQRILSPSCLPIPASALIDREEHGVLAADRHFKSGQPCPVASSANGTDCCPGVAHSITPRSRSPPALRRPLRRPPPWPTVALTPVILVQDRELFYAAAACLYCSVGQAME